MTQNPRRITRSRAWSALVLCAAYACLTSASAMGATHARTPLRQMFGNAVVESTVDHNSAGRAEAFPFRAAKSGTVTQLDVYVDRRNGARVIFAGLYSNSHGHPARRLAWRKRVGPQRGRWNRISIHRVPVKAGHTYWIALLGRRGAVYFRDRNGGRCTSESSRQSRLSSLPSTWRRGHSWHDCPISAFASGQLASSAPAPTNPSPGPGPAPVPSPPPPPPSPPTPPANPGKLCAGTPRSQTVSQASLDACGFPSVNNTGPAAGTALTSSGGFTASTAGKVYNGLNVNGSISITASNVTIQNSNITDVDKDNAAIQIASGVTGVVIKNDSIHGTNAGQSGALAFAVSYFGNTLNGVTIDHTNFYNGDRILAGYGTVTNSYCLGGANFNNSGGLEHDECIYTDGGTPGIRAIHDTLLVDNAQTAAIFVDNPDFGGGGTNGTVDVENSILAGGGYCIYAGGGNSTAHTGPVTITGNRFTRIFYSNCGQYGPDVDVSNGATWSGNVWDDTNQTVPR